MISPKYVKGALLVALVALLTVNAVPTSPAVGDAPKIDTSITQEGTTQELATSTQAPPDDKNTTVPTTSTSTTPATTTETTSSTTTTSTTPETTTPSTTPPTTPSTTTTTTSTTAKPTTSTPTPTPTTSSTETPTTPAPPTPAPHCNRFDAYSFVGGMILAYGSLAISLVLYKFYKTHWNQANINNPSNYRTL